MRKDIRTAVLSMLALSLVLGIVFPLLITGIGQLAFPGNAGGQLVHRDGRLIGSREIGESFTERVTRHGRTLVIPDPRFFQTRPSGTTPADDAAATTFANLGPNSVITERTIAAAASAYLALNRPYDPTLTRSEIPVDAVDTSASGIDPDISPDNARIQAHRVAAVNHLPPGTVARLVRRFTGEPGLGFSGEASVNVLELNLAVLNATKEAAR